jgi:hypothetical protein
MEEVFYEYVVGGKIRLKDFVPPSHEEKYKGHPHWGSVGYILIPTVEDMKYFWIEESEARKCAVRKGKAEYIYFNSNMEVIPPLLPQQN